LTKKRLDLVLVEKGYFGSRQAAQAAIMSGRILVGGKKVDKSGEQIATDSELIIIGEDLPFVSRGGLKLAKALKVFPIDLTGKIVLDAGASTGGFTDCALQHNASKVIAVDVGYGQLAWKLRQDPRVKVFERKNIRYLTPADLDDIRVDVAVADLSFISLKLILPNLIELAKNTGDIILLIKPQFEAGKDKVGRKGVVKDPKLHQEIISEIISFSQNHNLRVGGLDYSPIKGPRGNIEYLLWLSKEERPSGFIKNDEINKLILEVVSAAHKTLA